MRRILIVAICLMAFCVPASAIVAVVATVSLQHVEQTTPEHPVQPAASAEELCKLANPDHSLVDYKADKETPVSFGPNLHASELMEPEDVAIPVLCGTDPRDHTIAQRGGNCTVYQGIEFALSGGTTSLEKPLTRTQCVRGVKKLVNHEIQWDDSWVECGVKDPKGSKTLYAVKQGGELTIKVDTLQKARTSCYVHLVVDRDGIRKVVSVRTNCSMQAGTGPNEGHWYR